jgi:hypothetical protein
MKRELMSALLGASLLVPVGVDAQRARHRAPQPAPVTVSGRLGHCTPPAGARPFDCRARVVYSSGVRYGPRPSRAAWVRVDWGRIRLAPVRYVRRDRFMNQGELRRLMGRHAVDRIRDHGRRAGLRGGLRGEWVQDGRRGHVLVVRMDRVDVAELVDFDRDGVVDDIFLMPLGTGGRWVAMR